MTAVASAASMSAAAQARLKKPRTRGAFMPIDAARRQLGLLAVADGLGQARISWLVDLATSVIADSRFLAFGALASHPIADVFSESVRGRTVADAATLTADQLDALLRDDPLTPAFPDALEPFAFVADLQARAMAALPGVTLLPKPAETIAYQRRRELDWSDRDRAWFALSYLRKVARVDAIIAGVLSARLPGASHTVEALNDDFRVMVRLAGLAPQQVPTALQFITDDLHGVHPELRAEALP